MLHHTLQSMVRPGNSSGRQLGLLISVHKAQRQDMGGACCTGADMRAGSYSEKKINWNSETHLLLLLVHQRWHLL